MTLKQAKTTLAMIRPSALARLLRTKLAQNAIALYSSQISSYILPLVTIPFLTRVLGPEMWGRVAFGQAAGVYAFLIVDYGFNYSASRDVARSDDDRVSVADLVAGVVGARAALSAACFGVAFLAVTSTSSFGGYGTFVWLGVMWGVMLAIRPAWYFLGRERLRLVTTVDVLARVIGTLGIFALVRGPQDAALVLVMQILAATASAAVAIVLLYREVAFRLPSFSSIRAALHLGLGFFMLQSAYSVYASSNVFIIGLLAPGPAVGFYAVPEKLQRAIVNLTGPATQAMYPRSSNLVVRDPARAARLARLSTLVILSSSVLMAAFLFATAPLIIPFVFGPAYGSSVPILRVLALVLIPVGMSIPLNTQWLFPLGFEHVIAKIAFVAGALHVVMAVVLVYFFSAIGAAYALVTTETLILGAIWFVLVRKGISPFSNQAVSLVSKLKCTENVPPG